MAHDPVDDGWDDEAAAADDEELEHDATVPLTKLELDAGEAEPLEPPPLVASLASLPPALARAIQRIGSIDDSPDAGTRTIMGVGARAVRAKAKSGWVRVRPVKRDSQSSISEVSDSHAMREDLAEVNEAASTIELGNVGPDPIEAELPEAVQPLPPSPPSSPGLEAPAMHAAVARQAPMAAPAVAAEPPLTLDAWAIDEVERDVHARLPADGVRGTAISSLWLIVFGAVGFGAAVLASYLVLS